MDNLSMDSNVEFGFKRAAVSLGIDPYELLVKKASQDIVDNSLEDQKLYSRAGAIIFERAGLEGSVEHRILQKCASYDTLLSKEAYTAYVLPVKDTLCKLASMLGKAATGLYGMLANTPALALALAVGTGGLGGAGIYALQRAMNLQDAETEAKFEQAKLYREAAEKIQEQMGNKATVTNKDSGFIF